MPNHPISVSHLPIPTPTSTSTSTPTPTNNPNTNPMPSSPANNSNHLSRRASYRVVILNTTAYPSL